MFTFEVYETEVFYSSLSQIPVAEGLLVRVYPIVTYDLKLPTYKWGFITYRDGNWEILDRLRDFDITDFKESEVKISDLLIYKNYVFLNMEVLKRYLISKKKLRTVEKVYPVPPSVHSSLYLEEKAKLDKELEDYHKESGCNN